MSWLSSFIHPGNPYKKAQGTLNQYHTQGQQILQPYNQHGLEQYGNLENIIRSLLNPEGLENKLGAGYNESESAKDAERIARGHGAEAAGALGIGGSNAALNAIQKGTSQIALNDKQNYLDRMMQRYLSGANLVGNVYGTGANTAARQSSDLSNMGQNSAQLSYNQENAGGNLLSKILGKILPVAGGFALGGPEGALSSLIGGSAGNVNKWNLKGGHQWL